MQFATWNLTPWWFRRLSHCFSQLKTGSPNNVRVLFKGYFFKETSLTFTMTSIHAVWAGQMKPPAYPFLVMLFVRWWQDVKDATEMLGFVIGVTEWTVSLWYGSRQRWNYLALQRNSQLSSWFTESVVKKPNRFHIGAARGCETDKYTLREIS